MDSSSLRSSFIQFYQKRQHHFLPSSSLIPQGDTTLLFTNAGMNPFKDIFLGEVKAQHSRVVSSQKCIRAGGKHNDLENVGHTQRHCSFFEMLGNFSFGDYFKSEAIAWAWEWSTEVLGLDPQRIWPTVYESDDEAFALWEAYVPAERISRMGEKDNFWSMGSSGPCGPCSELLFDRGAAYGSARNPLEDTEGSRFAEFWNLVFMQSNRLADTSLEDLPMPCVDTGAGLERLLVLKGNCESVFETDVLRALIAKVESLSGKKYAQEPAFRVIADHFRSLAFAIADGAQPSNVERGYVLRKLLRRALTYARHLGLNKPFLGELCSSLEEKMGEAYPQLLNSRDRIQGILKQEEEAFLLTLKRGGKLLSRLIDSADGSLSGEDAFKLKDTYGLPFEEIRLMAKDAQLVLDEKGYQKLEEKAKERSRSARASDASRAGGSPTTELINRIASTSSFVGEELRSRGKLLAICRQGKWVDEAFEGEELALVFDRTCFYPEGGGQQGDRGCIKDHQLNFIVKDCQSSHAFVLHMGTLQRGKLSVGDDCSLEVDAKLLQASSAHHSATHLLQHALSEILGPQIQQAGSLVQAQRMRFDFSHHSPLTPKQLLEIEDAVNTYIRKNFVVETSIIPYEEIKKRPEIRQMFGEKYGESVRLVSMGASLELCGGTHVKATGEIGLFRIKKETSIAAGLRRIEACCGQEALELNREKEDLLLSLALLFKSRPEKLLTTVEKHLEEHRKLSSLLDQKEGQEQQHLLGKLLSKQEKLSALPFLYSSCLIEPKALGVLIKKLRHASPDSLLIVLGEGSKAQLILSAPAPWCKKGITAPFLLNLLKEALALRGGGKEGQVQASVGCPEAFASMREILMNILEKKLGHSQN